MFSIIFRVIFSYFLLLILTRLSRKRTLYEATPHDFIVVLLVGDLIDNAIWHDVSLINFSVAVSTIFLCHVLNKILVYRSALYANWIQGQPTLLWKNNQWNEKGLRRHRINKKFIFTSLKEQEIENIANAKTILLEVSSNISINPSEEEKKIQKKDFF